VHTQLVHAYAKLAHHCATSSDACILCKLHNLASTRAPMPIQQLTHRTSLYFQLALDNRHACPASPRARFSSSSSPSSSLRSSSWLSSSWRPCMWRHPLYAPGRATPADKQQPALHGYARQQLMSARRRGNRHHCACIVCQRVPAAGMHSLTYATYRLVEPVQNYCLCQNSTCAFQLLISAQAAAPLYHMAAACMAAEQAAAWVPLDPQG